MDFVLDVWLAIKTFIGETSVLFATPIIPAFVMLFTIHEIRIPFGGLQTKYSNTIVNNAIFP